MSPKAQKDWFRRKTWTESDRQEFEATLSRARTGRPGYLRIQAFHLAESADPALLRVAQELLDRALRDHPDDVAQRAAILHQKADCLWRLGDTSGAVETYRQSFRAEDTTPTIQTGAWLEFGLRVVREGKAELYGEVEALLEHRAQAQSSFAFPVQKYQYHLVRALIANHAGRREAAVDHARAALDAAGPRQSGSRYHANLGLVGKLEPTLHETLLRLAGADRAGLVRKLVTTLHLNVSERRILGGKVDAEEVIATILVVLAESKFFPAHVRPWQPGQPCGDGTILELLPGGIVRAHYEVSSAWMTPAHLSTLDFPDARAAAIHLVRSDFANGIDGVPVV